MNLTFERATPADAEALVEVQIAAFHHDTVLYGVPPDGPPGYNSVEHALKKIAEEDYYKIVLNGQIVGGIDVWDEGEGHFHLDLIYLDPALHNRGIGSQAMEFIHQTYPAQRWTLDTPSYAVRNQHFYEKFGYIKVSEEAFPGITLFGYEKKIEAAS
jgi:ribosomal protein S18 acetylase RimI-like enzyme